MKKLIFLWLLLCSFNAWCDYNANMVGVLKTLAVYSDDDYIYLQLENQPTQHPVCNPSYFVITADVPQNRIQMLLSRLSMAYATGERVNIGYDAQGHCANGFIRLHRAG